MLSKAYSLSQYSGRPIRILVSITYKYAMWRHDCAGARVYQRLQTFDLRPYSALGGGGFTDNPQPVLLTFAGGQVSVLGGLTPNPLANPALHVSRNGLVHGLSGGRSFGLIPQLAATNITTGIKGIQQLKTIVWPRLPPAWRTNNNCNVFYTELKFKCTKRYRTRTTYKLKYIEKWTN